MPGPVRGLAPTSAPGVGPDRRPAPGPRSWAASGNRACDHQSDYGRHVETSQVGLQVTGCYSDRVALPTWVPDDETKPAPMPLLVVQSFVNTWEADSGVDLLRDPVAGPEWLPGAGVPAAG